MLRCCGHVLKRMMIIKMSVKMYYFDGASYRRRLKNTWTEDVDKSMKDLH